jgi:xanthine dehydrogenase YagR molybdenum-binding subunit
VGNDFAGYHFPVNADAPVIETFFIDKPDPNISSVGSKGLGEVGYHRMRGCNKQRNLQRNR